MPLLHHFLTRVPVIAKPGKEYLVELTVLVAAGAFKAKAAGELDYMGYKMITWL